MGTPYLTNAPGAYWFVFGRYADGCVDVSNGNEDVLVHVSTAVAGAAIHAHNAFVDRAERELLRLLRRIEEI